jgi:hypothetical protein
VAATAMRADRRETEGRAEPCRRGQLWRCHIRFAFHSIPSLEGVQDSTCEMCFYWVLCALSTRGRRIVLKIDSGFWSRAVMGSRSAELRSISRVLSLGLDSLMCN